MLDFGYYNMDCMDGMKEFPDKYSEKGGLTRISDEDLPEVAEHTKAITEILKKYRKE